MDLFYWNGFYKECGVEIPSQCSTFAKFCFDKRYFDGSRIYDLGAGNGRDATFFCSNGFEVVAVDQVDLEALSGRYDVDGLTYLQSDFCSPTVFEAISDAPSTVSVYSRFSLHAISEIDQSQLISKLDECSKIETVAIEARSIFDSRFGVGEPADRNAFIDTHYRRFIDPEELYDLLSQRFRIVFFEVSDGLSPYQSDDPVVVRLVGRRR